MVGSGDAGYAGLGARAVLAAGVLAFSPFAVRYAAGVPGLEAVRVKAKSYRVGEVMVPLELPAGTADSDPPQSRGRRRGTELHASRRSRGRSGG